MENKKYGVSLIILVVTIMVLAMVSGTAIITLVSTDIISKSSDVVDMNNTEQWQELANLAWTDAHLDYLKDNTVDIKERVTDILQKQGLDLNKYVIKVTEYNAIVLKKDPSGADPSVPTKWRAHVREYTDDKVPIPKGFVVSPYPNEGKKKDGLVIYALREDEIAEGITTITDEYEVALKTRNQFVWVPVDDFKGQFKRSGFGIKNSSGNDTYPISNILGTTAYWEVVVTADNDVSQDTINDNVPQYITPTILAEATEMYKSVKEYGGFYIARYEAGTSTIYENEKYGYIATRVSIEAGTNSNLSVTMGKYPYSLVSWSDELERTADETSDDAAVSLARSFYPKNESNVYGAISTLTYGVQWDRTLNWWKEQDESIDLTNSIDYGIYKNTLIENETLINKPAKYSIVVDIQKDFYSGWNDLVEKKEAGNWVLTTGALKSSNKFNIYDMAGNLEEWTMEGRSMAGYIIPVYRGGSATAYSENGKINDADVIKRYFDFALNGYSTYGFRPSLYIKLPN